METTPTVLFVKARTLVCMYTDILLCTTTYVRTAACCSTVQRILGHLFLTDIDRYCKHVNERYRGSTPFACIIRSSAVRDSHAYGPRWVPRSTWLTCSYLVSMWPRALILLDQTIEISNWNEFSVKITTTLTAHPGLSYCVPGVYQVPNLR